MKLHADSANIYETDFTKMVKHLSYYLESTIALNEDTRPTCCGQTENLRSGYAGDNLIWLCPRCAREANHEGM